MATLAVEKALVKRLEDDAAVGAIAGDRIFPGYIPQSQSFPAIVYERADSEDAHHMGGRSGLNIDEFDFVLYSESYATNKALAAAVTAELDGAINGTEITIGADSILIQMCHLVDEYEDTLRIDDGSGRYLFSITQTYKVGHKD